MAPHDMYILILCVVVFTLLTGLLSYLIVSQVKMYLEMVRAGLKDEAIRKQNMAKKKKGCIVDFIVSFVLCLVLLAAFGFSLFVNLQEERFSDTVPTLSVVKTTSMAKKNPENKYLFENGLNNQLSRFDLIFTYKKPAEKDLKLFDIVVYQQDDLMVVHRIVGIEEPNEKHPNDRYFLCQGDAVDTPDRFPVKYSQIKGIYRNEKIPFVGSFVLFMQSPAGWLCILLVIFALIATPIAEKKIWAVEEERLKQITDTEVQV